MRREVNKFRAAAYTRLRVVKSLIRALGGYSLLRDIRGTRQSGGCNTAGLNPARTNSGCFSGRVWPTAAPSIFCEVKA